MTIEVRIPMTKAYAQVLADHGPYTLRPDGVIEDRDGASLTNCRPNARAEECDWDRALVAALNGIAGTRHAL